jgi:CubicO group peptidase (beta-lactamase class C family)
VLIAASILALESMTTPGVAAGAAQGNAGKNSNSAVAAMPSLEAMASKIKNACERDEFSGAALVATGPQPDWATACGYSDREHKTPMTRDTPMRIASMGKMFTIVAILQLIDSGKVELESPIIKYLPDYPNTDLARAVTIHHLLGHTGGTGDIFGPEGGEHRAELRSVDDYVRIFGPRPALFPPGQRFAYSNFGYILLGAIIERVAGVPYYDYVEGHIFKPAGMTKTSFPIEHPEPSKLSTGYTHVHMGPDGPERGSDLSAVPADQYPVCGTPAGGGFSTVGDLARFALALLDGKLISSQALDGIVHSKELIEGHPFAYGFLIHEGPIGRVSFGHNGGAPGQNGEVRVFATEHRVIVTLSNIDPPSAITVMEWISPSKR